MSEIRQNKLTGEWTIYAANRNGKPYDFIRKTTPKAAVDRKCPFCSGNEEMTTKPVYMNGEDGNWSIRVFPNLYPAVSYENIENNDDNFYNCYAGRGMHEVVVDTDSHEAVIHDFSVEHIKNVLEVIKDRVAFMKKQDEVDYVQVFKNCGPDAGASINHSHWQIIGCHIAGIQQMLEAKNCNEYYSQNGRCLLCDMREHEAENEERVVAENEFFTAFVPFAGKMAFEVYIVPKRHIFGYENLNDDEIAAFAEILKAILNKVKTFFNGISYNICFQDGCKGDNEKAKHWYARVLPRIGSPAGYEFGTGTFINPITPEYAAKRYKDIK